MLTRLPRGRDHTTVDAAAAHPLGERYYRSTAAGAQIWIYVENEATAAAAWAAGHVISRLATSSTYQGILAPVDTQATDLLGVAQHAIAAGSFGWILREGVGLVLAGTETIDDREGVYVSATDAGTGMEEGVPVTASNTTITNAHLAGPFAFALADAAGAATATCVIHCRG